MKILICCIFLLACVSLKAQEHVDVTVQDANQLKPGASAKEIRDWIKSQAIQSAVSSALQQPQPQNVAPQSSRNAAALPKEPIEIERFMYIYGSMLDPLLKLHPELKVESDALYVEIDDQLAKVLAKDPTNDLHFPNLKVQFLRSWVASQLTQKHQELKPECDAMYVEYDAQFAQKNIK